ncbi:MAG: hypothetical protein U0325_27805 [Polyangiales bacterium]
MRHVIAVTARPLSPLLSGYREAPSAEVVSEAPWLPVLAQRLATTVYELRGRFAGAAPWVLGRVGDPWEADAHCQFLRRNGFGAVVADLDALRSGLQAAHAPLRLEGDVLELGERALSLRGLDLLVEAMTLVERAQQSVEHRVVGMNGRGEPTVVDITSVRYAKDRQRVLYLFGTDGTAVRLPQELAVRSGFAGATSLARFEALRNALRSGAPQAHYDPRFIDAPRKRTSYALTTLDHERNLQHSDNVDETNVAAWVLHLARRERQRT